MLGSAIATERRAQLAECAVAVAGRDGVEAATADAVAHEAGLPTEAVRDCFETEDSLLEAMSEALIREIGESVQAAFADVDLVGDESGSRGLRILLHNALSRIWSVIESAPERNVLLREITAYSLRRQLTRDAQDCAAVRQYRLMDTLATAFLEEAARRTGTIWLEPVSAIAQFGEALLDGLVGRWLVDRSSETMIIQLDDLAGIIAAKAVPA
ncbi:TetR/AcrR family transcriptional regulator [Skermania sp. ID1734]|uniref:TetR/AcrR family transcriptional regulator n=1 Tax=Skermania sp. ID1734 TaxID=2597516 RepID=UPI00117C1C7E|nr:TetR/AcrR family transcriptional regulator [Skermania sp. ID1734]TSE01870.1 TetR/AcrR family transcriptional regulator [Skermania sp. ID1734]